MSDATAIKCPCPLSGDCYFDRTPHTCRRLAQRRCHRVCGRLTCRPLCRAWPPCALVTRPSLPLLGVGIASTKICPSLHSPRRPSTYPMSLLPCAPAIWLSPPSSCVAIASVAVCPSLLLPRVAIASAAICPYLRTPTTCPTSPLPRALSICLSSHLPRMPVTLSCRQLPATLLLSSLAAESFLADCCIASCCPAASRHLSSCRLLAHLLSPQRC